MKARIILIQFQTRKNYIKCTITFNDPYCNNVKRIVKGVAKCNPDDTFDETLGQRIAEGRAKRAMFLKLSDSAYDLQRLLSEETYKNYKRVERETKHIQELLNNHYNEQQDNKKA